MSYSPIDPGTQNWDVPLNAALTDQDLRITDNLTLIQATNSAADLTETTQNASDHGLLTWNYDPAFMSAGSGALASGTLYLNRVKVTANAITNSVMYVVNTAGGTLTSGQNFMALFDSAGNRIAITADLTATDFASTGTKTTPWVSTASIVPGFYYVALLTNGTTGVNVWKTTTSNANGINANLSAATYRYSSGGTGLTGLTAVPSTVTMANRSVGSNSFWCALL
jgi:hypothetical protein